MLARMEAYLARVPGGLDGHPDCLQKGSIVRSVLRGYPLSQLPQLPQPLQALRDEPPLASAWIPEVHANALYLAICDAGFDSDQAYVRYSFDFNQKLLRSPLYRFLMLVASPERLLRHAPMRWGALHRGTSISVEIVSEGKAHGVLRYPEHLFPPLMVECFATAYQAALEGSGGQNADVHVAGYRPTECIYTVSWT